MTTTKLTDDEKEANKQKIIALFRAHVLGKKADVSSLTATHDGKHGHWLETAMGVSRNRNNAPDLLGYEMKNATQSMTSFGDWSADYRIFSKRGGGYITQDDFLQYFGKPNPKHNGRFAWSGQICPNRVNEWTFGGQTLLVDADGNISAVYSYSRDTRPDKATIVPQALQQEELVLARWSADFMRNKVERKFNQNGWFKCVKDKKTGQYTHIIFGEPMTFETWIAYVRDGKIIFDSGMHQGNVRPYANWRATNAFWDSLVTSQYS